MLNNFSNLSLGDSDRAEGRALDVRDKQLFTSGKNYMEKHGFPFLIWHGNSVYTPKNVFNKEENGWTPSSNNTKIMKELGALIGFPVSGDNKRGSTADQTKMYDEFKQQFLNMKTTSFSSTSEDKIKNSIKWLDETSRKVQLFDIKSNTKTKGFRLSQPYESYMRLCAWIDLYEENIEHDCKKKSTPSITERHQFICAKPLAQLRIDLGVKDDNTGVKPILSKVFRIYIFFSYLPSGAFEICSIPITYWRNIKDEGWKRLLNYMKTGMDETEVDDDEVDDDELSI